MEYIGLILFVILVLCLLIFISCKPQKPKAKKVKQRYDARGFDFNHIHRNGTKFDDYGYDFLGYDANGFNQYGYNAVGKNAKGQYDRFYDTKSSDEEGFRNPMFTPIALTDHACERMYERLGITNRQKMMAQAKNAYRFGKSKRQMKKTSAYLVDEVEKRYDNSIVLIYKGFIYVFTENNVLKTVYKNDRIPL